MRSTVVKNGKFEPGKSPKLYHVVKASYGHKDSTRELDKSGYRLDPDLSSRKQKVLYNKKDNKFVLTVAGTSSPHDIFQTNPMVALGKTTQTKRFKHSQDTYDKTVTKYPSAHGTVVGHSLGGDIASRLRTRDSDRKITYNKAATPGYLVGTSKNAPNEIAYRNMFDPVSVFAAGSKRTRNLTPTSYDPLLHHSSRVLKHSHITI